jgi:biopolymer transport protein ExbD
MRPIRRTDYETRVEMMPLIDVVFLLLTFFVYAMVLMVRAEVLPVPLESYVSGTPAERRQSISITIAVDGKIYVGQEIVQLGDVGQKVLEKTVDTPDSAIYLVVEDGESNTDRGPILTGTWDQLRNHGLEIFLVGAPNTEESVDASP